MNKKLLISTVVLALAALQVSAQTAATAKPVKANVKPLGKTRSLSQADDVNTKPVEQFSKDRTVRVQEPQNTSNGNMYGTADRKPATITSGNAANDMKATEGVKGAKATKEQPKN